VDTGVGTAQWQSKQMTDGTITTAYAGGCVWISDNNGADQALVVGASVVITDKFTASRP
jgi:hypothetical protein